VQAPQGAIDGSQLLALSSITSMTTIGTCLGVAIRARDSKMKNLAFGSLFPGAFGISEPTYYSISLIRPILFLPVAAARGLTGVFIGALNVRGYQPGGRGILGFTAALSANAAPDNLLKMIIAMVLMFGICFGLTLLVYQERKNEKRQVKNLPARILKKLKLKKVDRLTLDENKQVLNLANKLANKDYLLINRQVEKLILKKQRLTNKISKLEAKISKKQAIKVKNEKQASELKKIIARLEKTQLELKNNLINVENKFSTLMNQLENLHLNLEENLKKIFIPLKAKQNLENQTKIDHLIFNTVHDLEINYQLIEKLEV
jgi:hypothetical protein